MKERRFCLSRGEGKCQQCEPKLSGLFTEIYGFVHRALVCEENVLPMVIMAKLGSDVA